MNLQDNKAAFLVADMPSKLRLIKTKCGQKHARRWKHFKENVRAKVKHRSGC